VSKHQQRASAICGRPIGIALHGSSGLQECNLHDGVAAGVAKVNWSSESLLIRSQAAQEFYASHSAELVKTHPSWKTTAMDNGVQTFVSQRYLPKVMERIGVLSGMGMSSKIRASLLRGPQS
jgi:fructose/tagatose bisphosphate aldolase